MKPKIETRTIITTTLSLKREEVEEIVALWAKQQINMPDAKIVVEIDTGDCSFDCVVVGTKETLN